MTLKQKSRPDTSETAFSNINLQAIFYSNNYPTGNNPTQRPDCDSAEFHCAIRAYGLEPPGLIAPGELHRFPGAGKGASNRAGWCILFPDGLGGCFGDFSSGLSRSWRAKRQAPFSPAEREWFKRQVTEAKAQAEADRRKAQEEAARRAGEIWQSANPPDPRHPYLVRKGVALFPETLVRQRGESLVLPVTDFTGAITSLQFIAPDGAKRLLAGGRKQGCFIHVHGGTVSPHRLILCEGWATGHTLAEDEPEALVLAAIDAGNLEAVAMQARHHWPSAELVIAGDDDRQTPGNPGTTKAREAAIASGALLALPQWPEGAPGTLTDFNDLVQWWKRGASHE